MLGMEHQEYVHYAIPMRVMGMDYSLYKKQYDMNARKYKTTDGMTSDEYLSRMKKTDKFTPVITVVVYYGKKEWDGAKSLYEMLQLPDEWKAYVNDYHMLLVEARKNNLVFHNMNNRHLFDLLEILLAPEENATDIKNKAIAYADEHEIETNVAMAVAGAAKCKIDYQMLSKKGAVNMSSVFDELAKESRRNYRNMSGTEDFQTGYCRKVKEKTKYIRKAGIRVLLNFCQIMVLLEIWYKNRNYDRTENCVS